MTDIDLTLTRTHMARAYRGGDFDAVTDAAKAILAQAPDDIDATRYLVRIYTNRKETARAAPLWDKLTTLTPDAPEPFLQMARMARQDRDWAACTTSITRFLALSPDHPEALSILVQCHLHQKTASQIGAAFARLCKIQPRGAATIARQAAGLGMSAEIATSLRRLADDGDADAQALCGTLGRAERNAAIGFEIQKNPFSAAQCYRTMRVLDPGASYPTTSLARLRKPFLERARKAYQAGDFERAIEHCRNCIKIENRESEPYITAGRSAAQLDDAGKAFDFLARGMAHCPAELWLCVNYARAAERLGRAHEAYEAWHAVRDNTQDDAPKYTAEAARSLARLPDRIARQAQVCAEAGDFKQAFAILQSLATANLLATDVLADMQERVARLAERALRDAYDTGADMALSLAQDLAEFAPGRPYALRVAGRVLLRDRDYARAAPIWQALVAQDPDNTEYLLNLARCFHRMKDAEQARISAQALLHLDATHAEGAQIFAAVS